MQDPIRVPICMMFERFRLLPLRAIFTGQNFVAIHHLWTV
jgi:hypothetical protein